MSTKKHKILVIDDDPDIGLMIRVMLEYKGYTVEVTQRADMVGHYLQDHTVDLVIMDMLLSGANGTDICESLKKDPLTARLPVIMISAHPNAKQITMQAGADDFIAKPFDMQDLFAKISLQLQPPGNFTSTVTVG